MTSPAKSNFGIIVIDVQNIFVAGSANENMPLILANTKKIFQLAQKNQTPFLITYERSESGDYAIPDDLKAVLPEQQRSFVKTTYGATSLAAFASAVRDSGLSRFLLLGSETDVCIMQTALGLRRMGVDVLVVEDAIFSSETNPGPALRRMALAGIEFISTAYAQDLLNAAAPVPESRQAGVCSLIEPFKNGDHNVAVVLNRLGKSQLLESSYPHKTEKLQRLGELLLLCEWMELPVFVAGGEKTEGDWQPIESLPFGKFDQIVVAGISEGLAEISAMCGGRQLFVLEDTLLSSRECSLAAFIPLTYKSFFYDLKKSIDPREWPSPSWTSRAVTFQQQMLAPENLAPIRLVRIL